MRREMQKMQLQTDQFPTLLRNALNSSNRFHEDLIRNTRLGNPDCTEQVDPFTMDCLFECATLIRTEKTRLCQCRKIFMTTRLKRTTGFSGDTVHFRHNHCPSGIYGTP